MAVNTRSQWGLTVVLVRNVATLVQDLVGVVSQVPRLEGRALSGRVGTSFASLTFS